MILILIQVLRSNLLPLFDLHGCTHFQQDSAPCHTARITKKFLADNGIEVLTWPGNSPDLNPIENVWSVLKEKISGRSNMTVESVQKAVKDYWEQHMDIAYLKSLSDSMPKRIRLILRANGYGIKY